MTPQKERARKKAWQVPELVRLHAGRAEQNGLNANDGTGPGVSQS